MRSKPTIPRVCECCGAAFLAFTSEIRRGGGRFCRRACADRAQPGRAPIPLRERFWAKVDTKGPVSAHRPELGPCWLWTGTPSSTGYGKLRRSVGDDGAGTHVGAHRASWELHYGLIPDGLCVCHACDTPLCVRPDHLFLATNTGNTADRHAKRRDARGSGHGSVTKPERTPRGQRHGRYTKPEQSVRGEEHPSAKLCENDVRAIRSASARGDVSLSALARRYGLSVPSIADVVARKSWKHV